MPMTIKEWKEAEVVGYDVFLDTGISIRGFKCWNDKARDAAIEKFIEILKNDQVDFYYEENKSDDSFYKEDT
tara:strand:+ start:144 stop:359 length:216 start_codon:yes stop_codon:yes gene_type:complete